MTEFEELTRRLAAPFQPADIRWRVQRAIEEKSAGWATAYLTSRAIQQRLDETVGPENWRNRFLPWQGTDKNASQLCGISIYVPERGEWVEKFDGAENTDFESVKGGLSDSMKRCAVQWGIGRYLYGMEQQWVSVEKRGKSWYILDSELAKLSRIYEKFIGGLSSPAKPPVSTAKPSAPPPPQPAQSPPQPVQTPPQSTPPQGGQTPQPYWVASCVVEPAVNGAGPGNMRITVQNARGESRDTFLQGVDPAIVQGAWLDELQLEKEEKMGYAYYLIKHYRILPPQQAAA